jgi:hypothetical protein
VDLGKIGIADDDQRGKEIKDKVYGWDVVREKE